MKKLKVFLLPFCIMLFFCITVYPFPQTQVSAQEETKFNKENTIRKILTAEGREALFDIAGIELEANFARISLNIKMPSSWVTKELLKEIGIPLVHEISAVYPENFSIWFQSPVGQDKIRIYGKAFYFFASRKYEFKFF